MNPTIEVKVGKKNALYIPKRVAQTSGIQEGATVLLKAQKHKIIVELVEDPVKLALKAPKFASITIAEAEKISLEEQEKHAKSTA